MKIDQLPTTQQYIEMVREKLMADLGEGATDYRICKTLSINTASMSRYKVHRGSMDAKTAVKVARFLNLPEMEVIAATEAERARNEENKKFWASVFAEKHTPSDKDYRKLLLIIGPGWRRVCRSVDSLVSLCGLVVDRLQSNETPFPAH
jgi:hypothetical protein